MTNEKISEFDEKGVFDKSESTKFANTQSSRGLKIAIKSNEEEKKEEKTKKEKNQKNEPLQTPSFFNNIKGFFL